MIYKVSLNGKIYEVEVEEGEAIVKAEYEASLPAAAPAEAPVVSAAPAAAPAAAPVASGNGEVVKSPLPGTVNQIKVTTGQVVKAGDVIFILEAMKMENEITAPVGGKIGNVLVTKGASVETGTPLVEII